MRNAVLCICLFAVLLAAQSEKKPGALEGTELRLRDAEGRVYLEVRADRDGPILTLRGKDARVDVQITERGSHVRLTSRAQRSHVALSADGADASVAVVGGPSGHAHVNVNRGLEAAASNRIYLGTTVGGAQLRFRKESKPRILLGLEAGNSSLRLKDAQGVERAILGVAELTGVRAGEKIKTTEGALTLLDEKGKVTHSLRRPMIRGK